MTDRPRTLERPAAAATGPAGPVPAKGAAGVLTIERIVAVEPAREYRLDPRDRWVAFSAVAAGARQLFLLPLRGGPAAQLTASEVDVSDPQWSPDGRRLAYVRGTAIRVVDADGGRDVLLTDHPAGNTAPRWTPDGHRIAFVSRRRGWSQVWSVDAPVPRRGRPAKEPKPPTPVPVTPIGLDVDEFAWSPDGSRLALEAQREDRRWWSAVSVVDVASGEERVVTDDDAWEVGARWTSDGGLLLLSDADGWFQVVRLSPDLRERTLLTGGPREHGDPTGSFGFAALPARDGTRFAHVDVHDGCVDLRVAELAAGVPAKRPRGRPPKNPRPISAATDGPVVNPWPGVWRAVDFLADGSHLLAIGESERRPQELWLLPVPGAAPEGARARRLTDALPAVLRASPWIEPERVAFDARDGLRIEATLWRPPAATGRRGGTKVPGIVFLHGGPTSQSLRSWMPFKQLLAHEGFAVLDVDFRGSTGYGRAFRLANTGEWGHADAQDAIDAGRWMAGQSWCDGRLATYGGSYGGYLTLCVLAEEPDLWRAGVDLFGDSEIAESYRHGDRVGRLDLQRMMGSPDDPGAAPAYRRGSPLYRAERIEAPLLILHGRRDQRVVPLMSEKMLEALVIESKHHEVHWYDEEAHGWRRPENRRDAFGRILAFLKRHVKDETPDDRATPGGAGGSV